MLAKGQCARRPWAVATPGVMSPLRPGDPFVDPFIQVGLQVFTSL